MTKALRYPSPAWPNDCAAQLDAGRQHRIGHGERVLKHAVQVPARCRTILTEKLDRVLLHPWLGLPIFFGCHVPAVPGDLPLGTPLQDGVAWLLDWLRSAALEPLLPACRGTLYGLLLDGIYNGVGTVAAFVPIIVLFFLFMAMVEDSGYLSRAAFLMDALMARLGLDGRGFVMLLMGFGCNVPALMGTRVMRSRALRLLTMLVIPFSLCSARLQVFVFITAALFTAQGRAAGAVQPVPVQLRRRHAHRAAVQAAGYATTSRSCWNCRPTAFPRCARCCCAAGTRCATSCAAPATSSSSAWCWCGC